MNKRDSPNLEAAKVRFLSPLLGLTRLDCQRNLDIRNRLRANNLTEDIQLHQKSRLDHLEKWTEAAYSN
jgi:hypothetical protein